eukprot:TRINITY_DN3241_c0_g1_i8.p1 TRINITY_DN3241_c0_g1~~TRINITY_DN3241_c0_g1_i8.p1  ORF type:complete len:403 (-),score=80.37 TRINITY_DN3241_c0_g1_i8:36-1148(-)
MENEILAPSRGDIIKDKWEVINEIGKGAFGVIVAARDVVTHELVAMKLEVVDSNKQALKLEVATLKKMQSCPYVSRLITYGRHGQWNFMVMNLLGENLSELRKGKKFSLVVSLKIGLKVIPILESIHALGYVHRDIKPSNFVVGLYPPSSRREIFLIDFGLARRFVTNTGEVRKARDFTGFRGTARYASINSHMCRDLSRRDDMWSVFYLLVEFAKCQLPWSRLRDKDKIGEMKIQWNTPELVRGLPPEFLKFMNHLQSLKFGDPPDYLLLMNLLRGALSNCGETEAAIFGWEKQAPPPRLLTAINFVAAESFGQVLFASGGGRGLTVTSTIDTNLSSTNSKRYRTIVVNPKKPQPPKHLGEDPKSRTLR